LKALIPILQKTEGLIRKIKIRLQRSSSNQFNEVERWYQDDPHNLKRTDFDFLAPDSIVFDLGGYEGEWASNIYARYNCNVHVFEPVSIYADIIKKRFSKNDKIKVYALGLAESDSEATITIDKFSSRLTDNGASSKATEKIQLRSFNDFIREKGIEKIDLLKINIEGAEFNLLERLAQTGTLPKIKCLLIQFHDFAENAIARRKNIQESLSKTHTRLFDYEFVWECWMIK
jgi:FkbM family methyltransferase